jgi:hypothetical protein
LGQFKLPVTITPASNTTFFIDPVNGNDAFPGTAAQPWQSVENVLNSDKRTGSRVATVANAGNNVVVTILGGTYTEEVQDDINTPDLLAGSVTVLQAPFKKMFTLALDDVSLTLNKGYKLQDIKIESYLGSSGGGTAVKINHPTAGLASVDVKCQGSDVICVEVTGAGFHTLRDVRVDVEDELGNVGIRNAANANLTIIGGRVRPIGGNNDTITLIDSEGVLTATGLTVDMTNDGHARDSKGIVLQAAGSSVTNSTIKVSNNTSAVGIKVENTANPSTVDDNEFIGSGAGIGVDGRGNLSSFRNNTFVGGFTTPFQ